MPLDPANPGRPRATIALRWLIPAYASLVALVVIRGMDRPPYDDSYFFKRFALNFLDHGVFAWNLDDGPVYGNTSQLHQLLVTFITSITRTHTLFAVRVTLASALFASFAVAIRSSLQRGASLAPTLAFCSPVMLLSALSGMETALAVLLVTCLCAVCDPDAAPPRRGSWGVVLVVGIWLTRPDALLFAAPLLLLHCARSQRRLPLREISLLIGSIAAGLLLFRWYYGTALPLPFYAKQRVFSPYDAHFLMLSDEAGRMRLSLFVWAVLPLALLALCRLDRANVTLLSAALLFIVYHRATTVDIMGMHGRFYAPTLPLIAAAASRAEASYTRGRWTWLVLPAYLIGVGALALDGRLPVGSLQQVDNLTRAYYVLGTTAGLVVLARCVLPSATLLPKLVCALAVLALFGVATQVSFHPKRSAIPDDITYLKLHEASVSVFRGVETLRACFGDAIDVYHSEVGVVGLRFQHGTVTDLAGLLSRAWLFRERTFDQACTAAPPEALFLPHRNYVGLNSEIQRSRCIQRYVRVVADSSSPLHIRADLLPRYRACERAEEPESTIND